MSLFLLHPFVINKTLWSFLRREELPTFEMSPEEMFLIITGIISDAVLVTVPPLMTSPLNLLWFWSWKTHRTLRNRPALCVLTFFTYSLSLHQMSEGRGLEVNYNSAGGFRSSCALWGKKWNSGWICCVYHIQRWAKHPGHFLNYS